VSAIKPRHSRLKSSTTTRVRNRRPSLRVSRAKSRGQRWFDLCGSDSAVACGGLVYDRRGAPKPFLSIQPPQLLVVDADPPVPTAASIAASRSAGVRRPAPSVACARRLVPTPMPGSASASCWLPPAHHVGRGAVLASAFKPETSPKADISSYQQAPRNCAEARHGVTEYSEGFALLRSMARPR
jgi:hypothetical protein